LKAAPTFRREFPLLSLSNPGRPDAVVDFLRRLPASDVFIWIGDYVPSPLGAGVMWPDEDV